MRIKIGFFSVLLFLSLLLTHSYFAICALSAIILHELGHIIAARLCKVKFKALNIGIYGAGLNAERTDFSYKNEIIIALGGALSNLITVLASLPLYLSTQSTTLLSFIASSILLGIMNLLPIKTFDGGRILHSLLCLFFTPFTSDKILSISSFFIIFILWTISVYLMLIYGMGLSSFVFSLSLFSRFFIDT